MKVVRDIYRCIEAPLQWYKMFTGKLHKEGFELNPYNECIADKTINVKQCTIAWHFDDCVISYAEQKV